MTLWGGRFAEPPDEALWSFTVTEADRRLLPEDVRGSLAHVTMLARVGLLADDEAEKLAEGLHRILAEADSATFVFTPTDEDVHTAVERRLGELVGPVAGKVHTGRSRNDQVSLDLRLYLRRAAGERAGQLASFALLLAELAERAGETVVPAYTHLQQAQAVPFGHHLLAYGWMLVRDRRRFIDAVPRIDVSPLGAGAGGGSSLPLQPEIVASELGMSGVFANSLDAVASRDFVAEYAFCCAQAMVHLSRLSEELVMWGSSEFGWASFSDRYTTGSSALPHKKNPDIAELVRGKAARVVGELTNLLALQKGLPLAYNRDLQEDKEAVFRADDALAASLAALAGMLATADFHPPPPSSWTTALDLAEALVRRGVAFREAHQAVGRLVGALLAGGRDPAGARVADLEGAHPSFDPVDLELVDPAGSVRR
ncbi:MAG: argininosuccinate lyase, partial [Acidimicrobiia bacterium]